MAGTTPPESGKIAVKFAVRNGIVRDSAAIATIYNEGIDDRMATFETEHRDETTVADWFKSDLPIAVVIDHLNNVAAFAAGFPYRARHCYRGIFEFSVYTRRQFRRFGCGRMALSKLIEIVRNRNGWKLVSRIFPENQGSRALCKALGFREVGTYNRHAKLDGQWRDVVIVEKLIDEEGRSDNG